MGLKENPGLSKLQKESPNAIDAINRTYAFLMRAAGERPVIFLAAVLTEEDLWTLSVKNS
jgi:hypothetical protein